MYDSHDGELSIISLLKNFLHNFLVLSLKLTDIPWKSRNYGILIRLKELILIQISFLAIAIGSIVNCGLIKWINLSYENAQRMKAHPCEYYHVTIIKLAPLWLYVREWCVSSVRILMKLQELRNCEAMITIKDTTQKIYRNKSWKVIPKRLLHTHF